MVGMRRVRVEGGWAMVCTEQCEIHRELTELAPR